MSNIKIEELSLDAEGIRFLTELDIGRYSSPSASNIQEACLANLSKLIRNLMEKEDIDDTIREMLCIKIISVYDIIASSYIDFSQPHRFRLPPGLNIGLLKKLIPKKNSKPFVCGIGLISFNYFYGLISIVTSGILRLSGNLPTDGILLFDELFHQSIRELSEIIQSISPSSIIRCSSSLMAGLLRIAETVYVAPENWAEYKPGYFSSLSLPELSLLTSRAESVVRKYGAKKIEKIFEYRLSLVMQSFGLFVVPTTTGARTIDLLCISNHPRHTMSFLLEAKTSKHPYSLPTKDSRAVREYIREYKSTLLSFPELKFVLIIGPAPSRSLAAKISDLESSVGIPIRFFPASLVASLREAIPGNLPLDVFADHIGKGEGIIDSSVTEAISGAYGVAQQAHKSFVEQMMKVRRSFTKKAR
jgi:hypothetical protein